MPASVVARRRAGVRTRGNEEDLPPSARGLRTPPALAHTPDREGDRESDGWQTLFERLVSEEPAADVAGADPARRSGGRLTGRRADTPAEGSPAPAAEPESLSCGPPEELPQGPLHGPELFSELLEASWLAEDGATAMDGIELLAQKQEGIGARLVEWGARGVGWGFDVLGAGMNSAATLVGAVETMPGLEDWQDFGRWAKTEAPSCPPRRTTGWSPSSSGRWVWPSETRPARRT
jgi:hypothetical protein